MQTEPNIIGPGLTPELKSNLYQGFKEASESIGIPFENEIEKTSEELEDLAIIGKFLTEELKRLELSPSIEIRPERVHFLKKEDFKDNFTDEESSCGLSITGEGIIIDAESMNRIKKFHICMHEFVHELAHKKYKYNKHTEKVDDYRGGYGVTNRKDSDEYYSLFKGFNEGVTELIVIETFLNHEKEIKERFQLSDQEFDSELNDAYMTNRDIIHDILSAVSESKNENIIQTWHRFKKGYFTGEMMHLRDLEHIQKGALRRLSEL